MNSLLLVIDLQNEFVNEYTKYVPGKVVELIESNKYDKVVFTRFINSEKNILYRKNNWKGCLDEKSKSIVIDTKDNTIIDKEVYTALGKELIDYINENDIDKIYLCGIDTECCVLKTAFDLFEKDYEVYVLENYCGCTFGKERHTSAIEILKRNIGENRIIK